MWEDLIQAYSLNLQGSLRYKSRIIPDEFSFSIFLRKYRLGFDDTPIIRKRKQFPSSELFQWRQFSPHCLNSFHRLWLLDCICVRAYEVGRLLPCVDFCGTLRKAFSNRSQLGVFPAVCLTLCRIPGLYVSASRSMIWPDSSTLIFPTSPDSPCSFFLPGLRILNAATVISVCVFITLRSHNRLIVRVDGVVFINRAFDFSLNLTSQCSNWTSSRVIEYDILAVNIKFGKFRDSRFRTCALIFKEVDIPRLHYGTCAIQKITIRTSSAVGY